MILPDFVSLCDDKTNTIRIKGFYNIQKAFQKGEDGKCLWTEIGFEKQCSLIFY